VHGELNKGNSVVLFVKPTSLGYSAHKLEQHTISAVKEIRMFVRPRICQSCSWNLY
jgi:hypothetical protein